MTKSTLPEYIPQTRKRTRVYRDESVFRYGQNQRTVFDSDPLPQRGRNIVAQGIVLVLLDSRLRGNDGGVVSRYPSTPRPEPCMNGHKDK